MVVRRADWIPHLVRECWARRRRLRGRCPAVPAGAADPAGPRGSCGPPTRRAAPRPRARTDRGRRAWRSRRESAVLHPPGGKARGRRTPGEGSQHPLAIPCGKTLLVGPGPGALARAPPGSRTDSLERAPCTPSQGERRSFASLGGVSAFSNARARCETRRPRVNGSSPSLPTRCHWTLAKAAASVRV
jgi:hypothetical protein